MFLRTLLAPAVLMLAQTLPAAAMDGQQFLDRINATLAGRSLPPMRAEAIEPTGPDAFTLRGISFPLPPGTTAPLDRPVTTIASLALTGVREGAGNGMQIDELAMDGLEVVFPNISGRRTVLTIASASGRNLDQPDPALDPAAAGSPRDGSLTTAPLVVTDNGAEMIRTGDTALTVRFSEGGDLSRSTFTIPDIRIAADPAEIATVTRFAALGLDTMRFAVTLTAQARRSTGLVELEEFSIRSTDGAGIALSLGLDGLTAEVMRELTEIGEARSRAQTAGSARDSEEMRELNRRMVALISRLRLSGMKVVIDDTGLIGRIIDQVSADSGQPRDAHIAFVQTRLAGLAPFVGASVMEALQEAMLRLANGGGHAEIALAPPAPLPFSALMGMAMADPTSLADALGLAVSSRAADGAPAKQ